MNLTDVVDFEYSEQDMVKPLKNITLSEADSTETFKFKPFEYERGTITKTAKGVINTIRDMQDLPEQVKIFGKRVSFGFGGYFGDTPEETERKKLNLITAERNLNERQAERYRFSSQKETESLAYGVGGGIVNYGTMLIPAGATGGVLKAIGKGAKAVKGAEVAGLGTMSVMELAGQVQDKTPKKDGEIDIEAMTPEWARKATGGTIAYTAISAVTEKYVGFGQQMRMWSKPIKWGGNITSKALTTLKIAGENALSEGMTEGIQDLEATGIGLLDGTLTMDKLPARLQQAWKSAIIGGIIGGGVGTAAAMKSARNVKKQLRDMVAPVVGEQDAQTVAEAIYDAGTDDMTKAISIELELSSELKNKHGKVWNSMLAAVSREIEGKPRFEGWTEDEKAHLANTVAKHFADNELAEANFRGTTLDAVLSASDITYDKGIRIARHINLFDALKNPEMIPAETKLKRETLLAFLKRNGGVIDKGGDIKSMDAIKQYPGLINKKGMTLDDAALMAWENGYFIGEERPTINDLLNAIDDGLRGNHRYNVEEEQTFSDAIDALREELDRVGIDYENMTAAEIEKAVDELPEFQSLQREADFYEQFEPEIGLSEDEAERLAIETEGKEYPIIDEKDLPERYYQIAEENARLDEQYPAYESETITINGQEKTVYNSNGDRIAKSKEALENFYNWFGDSKVVDEQGRPLVVYHGTSAEFDTFKKGNIFTTDNQEVASEYGSLGAMPLYIKLENPFIVDAYGQSFGEIYNAEGMKKAYKDLTEEDYKKLADTFFDGDIKEAKEWYPQSEQGEVNLARAYGEKPRATNEWADYARKEGYDGVIIKDVNDTVDISNIRTTDYVAFESNQIKSTSNRGTYSESENIYYQEGEDRDLVAVHSISARNLEKAIDFGGFPVPSIAIINKNQDFHFNNMPITLVGNKEMIDPSRSRNEVYNRDIWSKTFPFATYGKVKKKTRDNFRDNVKEYFVKTDSENELGSLLYYIDRGVTPERAVTEFQDSDGARLMYLEKEKGEKITIPTYDAAERKIENINHRYGIEANKQFIEKMAKFDSYPSKEVMEKDILPLINEAIDNSKYEGKEKYAERFRETARSIFIEDGRIDDYNIEGLVRECKEYVREKGTKKIDTYALRDMLKEKITDVDEYNKWAEKYIQDNLVGEPLVAVGKKLLPFNLENVTKAMTQGVTKNAQESFVYGSGKVIAAGAKQLKNIKEIKLEGKKLVSQEEQAEKIAELQDDMNVFTNKFMTSSDFTSSMQQKEAAFRALGTVTAKENPTNEDMQKALNYEFDNNKKYSDELLAAGVKIAKSSRNLARYYFEAKPQRAVRLNEFSGAIIPTDTKYDNIAKKVEDAGLKVIRSDNQTEALQELDTQNNVFFQRGKNAKGMTTITPDEYIIKLLEGADESTLPHEFAHYWLTEMWNYVRSGRASENYMKRWNIISDYLGVKPEQTRLTRGQQEKFASSYEAYLTRGELPTPLIGSAFDDYDKWLQRVYNDYNKINYQSGFGKRRVRLTDAAIKFFQSMTTGTLDAPALAPKDTGVVVPQEVRPKEVIEPTNEIVETPTTYDTTRVINITEGEKGVSKVFQREAMKHADRIVDELGVSYNKINLEEQAIKAAEWVQNNLEEARKVVNGAAAPKGIIDTAIFIAYENEMLRIGNNAEYQRALKIHSQVQTQRGQAIAAERISTDDVYNPAYWWKKLQKNKETDVARKLFKGDTEALNKMIETETKSIMKQIAGKPKEEQVEALTKLAEKLQKDYKLDTLYQMPDDVNERTVREFIKDTIGVNPDVMAGNEVINKAEQLQKLWENTKDKSGNPSVEAMRAKRELNDLIQAQTPSNALAVWTSIFGRGVMLASVKSPVLNIISNIEAGFTEGITRRLMYNTTEKAVDKSVKEEFSKYAWEVYKASTDIVTTMNDYDDDMRIIGEQILHSQGPGAFRAASRKVEEVSFKYLMGAPDVWAKTFAFNDTADLLATKIAKEEGAKDISKRATEIYKDAILIKPQTEVGQKVREQAQAQAHYTTFTNDSWAAKFGLSARNWLNMVGRNKVRLGDLTMKFVKTPANVQMMGLEYGFGLLYTAYNVQEIIKNPQSETSKIAIKAAVRNGLGIALAALLYSMLDPDDYFSEFDTLNPKEKDRMRAMGAMPNSIKIGNRWVSLDYFGQLGIPLVGMLEAKRNNGLRSYIQSGLTQAAKIPGVKETKQLIDNMSEYARYNLKPEKIAQMMAGTVLDQARAMTIPAIVNDIAKMTDDYERDTMGGVMDKVISSIPGLRQTLPEKYGIQGLVRTEPALSTLLFGSRVKTGTEDKLVREVEKLSKEDEQPSISDVTKYGDLRLLSPEKKVKVRKEFYKLYNSESKKLISTREYQKKSPEDKKKALNKVRNRVVKSLKEKYSNDIQREKRRR